MIYYNMKIFELPLAGLCNRLFAILYLNHLYKDENIEVIWYNNIHCEESFLNYFNKIDNMNLRIYNIEDKKVKNKLYFNKKIHSICFRNFNKYLNDFNNYKIINLNSKMDSIVKNIVKDLGDYIAIHVRRTDFNRLAKKKFGLTENKSFELFIDSFDEKRKIYIATDCIGTKNYFKKRYESRLHFFCLNYYGRKLRTTSLKDSIVDLFICIYSKNFMGTRGSAFSEFIKKFKNKGL